MTRPHLGVYLVCLGVKSSVCVFHLFLAPLAVQGLKLVAPVPVAGLPVKAMVELFNASPVAQQRLLELYVDGSKEKSSPVLKIPPERRLTHDFQFAFKTGGLHRGEVRLVGDDGSKLDDRRFFTMEVDQGIPVAIVQARRHEIPYLDDTFYLEQALSPGRSGGWALRTTTLTAGELLGEQLSRYTVVFCVNLPAPDADTAKALHKPPRAFSELAKVDCLAVFAVAQVGVKLNVDRVADVPDRAVAERHIESAGMGASE